MKKVSPKYKALKFTHNLTYNKRISSHHANYTTFLKRQQKKPINSRQTPLRAKDLVYDEPYFHCFQEALFPSLYIPLLDTSYRFFYWYFHSENSNSSFLKPLSSFARMGEKQWTHFAPTFKNLAPCTCDLKTD